MDLKNPVVIFGAGKMGRIFKEKIGTALASESSLKKDWLKPQEDEAWKDL